MIQAAAESFIERNGTAFQVVAAVLIALAGGAVGWILKWRSRDSITLDYRILSEVAIVSSHRRPERFRVLFGNNEVRSPFITQIEFRNTGTKAIEQQHFLEPIRILRPKAEILDWDILEQSANNLVAHSSRVLPIDGQPTPEYVEIQSETLNKNDSFVVQIVYDGDQSQPPGISCRVLNESREPREFRGRDRVRFSAIRTVSESLLAVLAGAAAFFAISWGRSEWILPATLGIAFAVALSLVTSRVISKDPETGD